MQQFPTDQFFCLQDNSFVDCLPDASLALDEPDGLLAMGGKLDPEILLDAYKKGIFPWYSEEQPIMWWSPNPRCVLFPEDIKISRSLRKTLRKEIFKVTFDQAFGEVIEACAKPRPDSAGTWITPAIKTAYQLLYDQGYAHSVECWHQDRLVGGLYGIAIGKVFFGESMFSLINDASKVALIYLVKQLIGSQFTLLDCQVTTKHLLSLGACEIPRQQFLSLLMQYCSKNGSTVLATP